MSITIGEEFKQTRDDDIQSTNFRNLVPGNVLMISDERVERILDNKSLRNIPDIDAILKTVVLIISIEENNSTALMYNSVQDSKIQTIMWVSVNFLFDIVL